MKKTTLLFCALFLLWQNGSAQCDPQADKAALVEFYNAMNGPNWELVDWDLSEPLDSLEGVLLDNEGCVYSFNLTELQLHGQIPDLNLPHLEQLLLFRTSSDTVPAFPLPNFSHLQNVKNMYIRLGISLGEEVPGLNLMDSLKSLNLEGNAFMGIDNSFNPPNLTTLYLYNNQITSLPDFQLPNLTLLSLYNNQLSNLPDFSGLPNLTILYLYYNQITSLPDFQLPSLTLLSLYNNQLSNLPDFSGLPNLTILYLYYNQITSLPDFQLPNLTNLSLSSNQLTEVPNFEYLPNLTSLNLSSNQLTEVPNFEYLPNLTSLYLSNNELAEVPNFKHLDSLKILYLNYNYLPHVPVFNFPKLTRIELEFNQLKSFPDLRGLSTITKIDLSHNLITGEIPNLGFLPSTINKVFLNDNLLTSCDTIQLDRVPGDVVKLGYNHFTFECLLIEGNSDFVYWNSPMKEPVPVNPSFSKIADDSLLIDLNFDDNVTSSTYTWFVNNVVHTTTNVNQLKIECGGFLPTDSLHVTVTNTEINQLYPTDPIITLVTERFVVDLEKDRAALIEFYEAMNGPNWDMQWDTSASICIWHGLTFNDGFRVEKLDINDLWLMGQLPNLNLPELTELSLKNLSTNALAVTGTLPPFSLLDKLKKLTIQLGTGLEGEVPDYNHLDSLDYLNLSSNALSGIDNDFNPTNLSALYLSINQITSIPDFQLPNLTTLVLLYNNLTQLPEFSGLPNLTHLFAQFNQLASVPTFANSPKMVQLLLNENQIEQIPTFNFPDLTRLDLDDNQLTTIPDLTNLPSVVEIGLSRNLIAGGIPNLGFLPSTINKVFLNNNLLNSCDSLQLDRLPGDVVRVSANHLTFECLLNGDNHEFIYNTVPQDTIPVSPTITRTPFGEIIIDLGFDENVDSSTYQWYKNGDILITTTNTNDLTVNCIDFTDGDSIHVTFTNSLAIDLYGEILTLVTTPFAVNEDTEDRAALIGFYLAMNGPNWEDTWDTLTPVCTWPGVTLNTENRVGGLEIEDEKLGGEVPNLNLPQLKFLHLINKGFFNGDVYPLPDFSKMPLLEEMAIQLGSQLGGDIPDFSFVPNLRILDLSFNNYTTVPDFSKLPALRDLQLEQNNITELVNFSYLPSISKIDLSKNEITGTIPSFGWLPASVTKIFLNDNQLDSCAELQLKTPADREEIVKVGNNRLTFGDLLRGDNTGFIYNITPQATVPVNPVFTSTDEGEITIDLNFDEEVTSSTYEWYVNGSYIETTNVNELMVKCHEHGASDNFHVSVTNQEADAFFNDTLVLTTSSFSIVDHEELCKRETIPTLFTPDGNGLNDEFIYHNLASGSELIIFNRWGNIVFQKKCDTPAHCGWDGKHNGNDQPIGTYYYLVKTENGKTVEGEITLVR